MNECDFLPTDNFLKVWREPGVQFIRKVEFSKTIECIPTMTSDNEIYVISLGKMNRWSTLRYKLHKEMVIEDRPADTSQGNSLSPS
jgi:hypothetical protein